jgi:hypothetical protein
MNMWVPKLIWQGIICHIIIPKENHFPPPPPPNHGVIDYIFVVACHDKITSRKKNLKFLKENCQQKDFDTICHDVHHKLHL